MCIEETVKYNIEFIQGILQVNEKAEKGYVVKVNDVDDIWKDILWYRRNNKSNVVFSLLLLF